MADDDVSGINMEDECMELPPGFRFHPTDEEIITHYLSPKVLNNTFTPRAIGEVDLNKCEPWDLPSKARMGEREWYFFCQRDRKYPTGMRTNRATQAGYWKATGKDKEIYRGRGVLVGMKKTLVFYRGRAPRGHKTNWVMHEYRLQGKSPLISIPKSAKDEWVVCRVFFKGAATAKRSPSHTGSQIVNSSLAENDLFDSTTLPPLADPLNYPNPIMRPASCFVASDDDQSFDFKDLNTPHLHPAAAFHPPAQVLLPNAYSSFGDSVNLGYLHHQEEEMLRALSSSVNTASTQLQSSALPRLHCKMEQCSQDASGDLVDVASSSGLAIDWDNMCKF